MPSPYSLDLRKRCIEALERGEKEIEVAKWGGVTTRTLRNWKKRERETGSIKAIENYHKGPALKLNYDDLKEYMKTNNDKTLEQIGLVFGVNKMTVQRALKKLGWTRKKNLSI